MDVAPDVDLGPVQQRMDPQMGPGREVGVELVPEFRRLVAEVPLPGVAARAEHPLLGAHALLVAADPGDDAGELVLGDGVAQAQRLARGRAGGGRQGRIHRVHRRALLAQQVELPGGHILVAEGIHFRELLAGVDMHHGKRHPPEERLAGEPDHDVGVLAQRPQHGQPVDAVEGLAQDVDALRFEAVEMVHGHGIERSRMTERRPCTLPALGNQ